MRPRLAFRRLSALRALAALAAFLGSFALFALTFAREAKAAEAAGELAVDLYTIGPGSYLYSRYGHSLLCTREAASAAADEKGRCYDYGVADRDDFVHMAWTSIRGTPSFVPIAVDESIVLKTVRDQGRQIERQRLPLTSAEAARLSERLEADVRERRAYAYHPYWANCSTQVRDRIDEAVSGRLRPGPQNLPKMRFREFAEDGLSGSVPELLAVTLFVGAPSDREPTPWESMYLPFALREGVAERLASPAERVADRVGYQLQTSRAVGRVVVFLLALVLSMTVRVLARRNRLRLALAVVAVVLGGLAVATDVVSLLVTWPEISRNWLLVLLLPTDLALPFLTGRRLTLYVKARLALVIAFGVLELVSVVAQPVLPVVALVALPMGAILSALRAKADAALRPRAKPVAAA